MTPVLISSKPFRVALLALIEPAIPTKQVAALGYVLILLCLLGCASPQYSVTTTEVPDSGRGLLTANGQDTADLERLVQLWRKRTQSRLLSDYPIGPGDVLEISVPAMEELRGRVVRVAGDGTIALPLIGALHAFGLTEEELREALRRRLDTYMYHPQLDLFVREYRSRQVAVVGAVAKPGLYNLTSEADTILDMVALAGGMREEAAQRILLIPAEPADEGVAKTLAAALPVQQTSQDPSQLFPKQMDPLVIDLENLVHGGYQVYLALPARPGDVIVVPASGQVLVQGWVEKPGAYKITPGLTVLGAVAAAGGPLYPADTTAVKVIRTGKRGERILYLADLEKIKNGEKPDIPAQEGDVIEVDSSGPKLVPYGVYRFFTSIFNVGMGASVPVR